MIGNCRKPLRQSRKGFSFTEILFAVMILGIGFIMVAAVFPVAIKQTRETVDETTAADMAEEAASYLGRVGTETNFPVTYSPPPSPIPPGTVVNYNGNVVNLMMTNPVANASFWTAVAGNLILPTDARYAWVPFYSRGADANGKALPYAQVTVICVQCQNAASFTAFDVNPNPTALEPVSPSLPLTSNLQGRAAYATFTSGAGANIADTVVFSQDSTVTGAPSAPSSYIGPGTYIVIANDSQLAAVKNDFTKTCNGFILRVGNPYIAPNAANWDGVTWELMPGSDMKNLRSSPTGGMVHVFIVGRGYNNAANGDTALAGPPMDIAAYSTFIQIRPNPVISK